MDSEKPKSGGIVNIVIALAVVSILGLGGGYAFSIVSLPSAGAIDAVKDVAAAPTKPAPDVGKSEVKDTPPTHGSDATKMKAEAEIAPVPEAVDERVNLKDFVLGPLPPVVTNLAQPTNVWVRLDGFLVVKKSPDIKVADTGPQMAPFILSYLKSAKITDLQGAGGLAALNSDLNEIVRTASNGNVHSVLLTGLIVE